jgi:hypothetical protein
MNWLSPRRDTGGEILLEKRPRSGIVDPLSDDSRSERRPESKARKLPGEDQDRPLEATIDDFRRILRADGTLDGNEDHPDLILRQIASLENGAATEGFLYRDLIPDLRGGVEHDLIFDTGNGTVLKFTKPDRAAYAVNFDLGTPGMAPALPLEYSSG